MEEKKHNTSNVKRENYLSWDETFMLMCCLIAQRSKDPNSQIGACVVDQNNIIVGLGYNGFPRNCSDDAFPWGRGEEKKYSDTKYAYVVHAEANAIYNANKSVKGCKLYTYLFPCNECAKTIVQTGIKEVIYAEDFYHDKDETVASRKILDSAGVICRQYKPKYDLKNIFCEYKKESSDKIKEGEKIDSLQKIEETIKKEDQEKKEEAQILNFNDSRTKIKNEDEPNQFIFENIS